MFALSQSFDLRQCLHCFAVVGRRHETHPACKIALPQSPKTLKISGGHLTQQLIQGLMEQRHDTFFAARCYAGTAYVVMWCPHCKNCVFESNENLLESTKLLS